MTLWPPRSISTESSAGCRVHSVHPVPRDSPIQSSTTMTDRIETSLGDDLSGNLVGGLEHELYVSIDWE